MTRMRGLRQYFPQKTIRNNKNIEMNDPNEGIETIIKYKINCLYIIIEMNDPNEGIETKTC